MAQRLEVPKFANEAEEARWWFENQDIVADEFELAASEGRLGHGRAKQRVLAARGLLQLESEDAERARRQAKGRGMEYQEYLKMVLHQALLIEEKSAEL
jgi:predicted DNA binding CopG/RHH family protein